MAEAGRASWGVTELGRMMGIDPNLALSVLDGLGRWEAGKSSAVARKTPPPPPEAQQTKPKAKPKPKGKGKGKASPPPKPQAPPLAR